MARRGRFLNKKMASRHLIARIAAAVALIALLWSAVIYLAAFLHAPRLAAVESDPLIAVAESWNLTLGEGRVVDDGLSIDRLDGAGEAFLVWRPEPFEASLRPVLELRIDHFPLNYVVMLAWRRGGSPDAAFTRLQVPRGGTDTYLMNRNPEWSGWIEEIALYLHPQPTSPPLTLTQAIVIQEMRLKTDSWNARVAALVSGWFAADPWAMMSVSSLGTYQDLDEGLRLTPLIFILFLVGVAVSGLVFRVRASRGWGRLSIGWLIAAALTINVHWLFSLAAQRDASNQAYAGLDDVEKASRLFDSDLVSLTTEAKRYLPSPPQARVFIAADARFFRLRAAWHLRPHNVFSFLPGETIGTANDIRPGDYLFFYRRPDLSMQARTGSIKLKRGRWGVNLLYDAQASGLLRFTERGS